MNGSIPARILAEFAEAFDAALREKLPEPTAMTLATADARGRPSSRTVLLKEYDERGFTFYTNLGSRKARQLAENPWASLTFHWNAIQRQVQVEGRVERVSDEEADAYWKTRPRESRIGAWASRQSETLASRAELLAEAARYGARFAIGDIPRPPYWSGFRVVPHRIELWKGMPFRLHERVLHERGDDGAWTSRALFP